MSTGTTEKPSGISSQYQLTADHVAEIVIAAFGQMGIDAEEVWFQTAQTADGQTIFTGATVVGANIPFNMRSIPDSKQGSVEDRYRAYMERIQGILMPTPQMPTAADETGVEGTGP